MTALLQGFTIRTRMLGAIAMVLVLIGLVGAAGLLGLMRFESIGRDFVETTHADTVALAELRTAIGNVRRYEKDLLINYDSAAEQAVYRAKWDASLTQARKPARRLAGTGRAPVAALAGQIDHDLTAYAEAATPVLRQVEVGGFNDAPVANKAIGPAKKIIHQAELRIVELAKVLEAETTASASARENVSKQALVIFVVALALAATVVVPLTLMNMASICTPIAQARTLAEQIAAGDLTQRVDINGRDEIAQLLRSLSAMQASLRSLVGQVRTSTDSITTASAEIASGNQDLSARTEQTASNLQQAASSMVQLTGTVKQSADSARQANQLAASAAEVAQRGGTVVSQVVSTMDEINTSSKRIADIIGTIDGIAFQTNILALNAAVEAARAGEQGRGFAVVASEVRSLAQRSADAAKEIKVLIGASVEKVEGGSRLVADAGRTMSEIVSSVQRVSDIIGEITAAASEQSEGIGQINGSVSQLDQMTQQNAALVEESAAAAESLKDQAAQLAQVIGTFRLEPGRTATATAKVQATPPKAAPAARPAPASPPAAPRPAKVAAAMPAPSPHPSAAAALPTPKADGDWETF